MKKTNKIISAVFAAILSFSMITFTSCDVAADEEPENPKPNVTFTEGCPGISSFSATPGSNTILITQNNSTNPNTVTYPNIAFVLNYSESTKSNFTVQIWAKNKTVGQADVKIYETDLQNSSHSFTYNLNGNQIPGTIKVGDSGFVTTTPSNGTSVTLTFYAKVIYSSEEKTSSNATVALTTSASN